MKRFLFMVQMRMTITDQYSSLKQALKTVKRKACGMELQGVHTQAVMYLLDYI